MLDNTFKWSHDRGNEMVPSRWQMTWGAWVKVKENQGASGVDGQSLEAFEKDLKNNLYRIWNRMSSGTCFPPPVKAVEIPKAHGGGTRILALVTHLWAVSGGCAAGERWAHAAEIEHGKGDECFG